MNKTWKLQVVSKEGVVVREPSKHSLIPSEEAANKRRNSYQAFWDKYYSSLHYHVRVVEVEHLPSYPTKRFHVYSDVGVYVGTFTEALAFAKAEAIDGTLVEAI